VNCTFAVSYALLGGYVPSQDEITSFGRGTAVFNCWPYAREFLRDITARMGHQTPALPLLRIVPRGPDMPSGKKTIDAAADPDLLESEPD
jgi:hypothetical protein